MSIVILGHTECSICGETIQKGDDYIGFSPCLNDEEHHLLPYSDSTVHRACLNAWKHREEFMALVDRSRKRNDWLRENFDTHQEAEMFLRDNPDWDT